MTGSRFGLCLAAAILLCSCSPSAFGPAIGGLGPIFQAPDLEGKRIYLNDFLGDPIVVYFYATWCGPCREEMIEMVEMEKDFAGRVKVIGVLIDPENSDRVRSLVIDLEINHPILADQRGEIASAYGVNALPRTFLIDQEGRIRSSLTGWGRSENAAVREMLKFMLMEQ